MSYTPTEPESFILEALNERLRSLLPLSHFVETDVAWPGYSFDEPADRWCLRVQFFPNDNQRVVIDSDGPHQMLGIYQVMVSAPIDNGELESRDLAAKIASHFGADTRMVYGGVVVRSTKRPTVAPSMPSGADLLTPVSVEYESYV